MQALYASADRDPCLNLQVGDAKAVYSPSGRLRDGPEEGLRVPGDRVRPT
jgi:hypothetical protein